MPLAADIARLIQLTEALAVAVAGEDLGRCGELLALRERALSTLAASRQNASVEELASCRQAIADLQRRDAALQRQCQRFKTEMGQELARARGVSRPSRGFLPLCVDRKV